MNFVDNESGVTVEDEPYIELDLLASRENEWKLVGIFPFAIFIHVPFAPFIKDCSPVAVAPWGISFILPHILGIPATFLIPDYHFTAY